MEQAPQTCMLMTNENIRYYPHDWVFKYTLNPLIPKQVLPNHITVLRFLLIPFVLYFLWIEDWKAALAMFLIAALTDALDGSMARVRKEITMWGTVADPIADKLLIGSVVVLFVAKEVNPIFSMIIVVMELLILAGAVHHHRNHKLVSANGYGKLKMFFQVAGVTILLAAKLVGFQLAVPFAIGTFSVAIIFAIVSLLTYGF